jgi:hypothetical protein
VLCVYRPYWNSITPCGFTYAAPITAGEVYEACLQWDIWGITSENSSSELQNRLRGDTRLTVGLMDVKLSLKWLGIHVKYDVAKVLYKQNRGLNLMWDFKNYKHRVTLFNKVQLIRVSYLFTCILSSWKVDYKAKKRTSESYKEAHTSTYKEIWEGDFCHLNSKKNLRCNDTNQWKRTYMYIYTYICTIFE